MIDFEKLPRFKMREIQIASMAPQWADVYDVTIEAVERQLGIAHVWCESNKKKAPKKDPVRFLNNWMRIAKNMGSLVSKPVDTNYKPVRNDDEVMSGEDFALMKEAVVRSRLKENDKLNLPGLLKGEIKIEI
jgi:hypothetical protein